MEFIADFHIHSKYSRATSKDMDLEALDKWAIIKVRQGKVDLEPGYDGVYGKINIFSKGERKNLSKQKTLF